MRVLITGGSGYLGQFLIAALQDEQHTLAYTYLTCPLSPDSTSAQAFEANLATGEGLQEAVAGFKPEVVVNCAALSQPAACERDYDACRAINKPLKLVEALQQLQEQQGVTALLIHLSTDQVFEGSRAWWSECHPTKPVNAYGRSKLEAEQLLQAALPGRFVALRSSLIFGPEPPLAPVQRPLFVQFVQQVLEKQQETTFFVDEFRCAVYVQDICAVVSHIISKCSQQETKDSAGEAAVTAGDTAPQAGGCSLAQLPHCIYNMGGPDRLSRHDMAVAVADHCQLSSKAILEAKSADVKRGYESPADISMKMDQLLADMPGIVLTPFSKALQHIFPRKQD